jgi:hypothetical protein
MEADAAAANMTAPKTGAANMTAPKTAANMAAPKTAAAAMAARTPAAATMAATTASAATMAATTASAATTARQLYGAADVFPIEEMERGETYVLHFLFAKNEALIGRGIVRLRDASSGRRGCGCTTRQRKTQSGGT